MVDRLARRQGPTNKLTACGCRCLLCAHLSLFVKLQAKEEVPLPSKEVLQQISGYSKNPVLAASASILAGDTSSSGNGGAAAIVSLPGHGDVELSALAKSCCCCNKTEGGEVSCWLGLLLREVWARIQKAWYVCLRHQRLGGIKSNRQLLQPSADFIVCCTLLFANLSRR